jgi:hypothetical protein
MRRGPAESAGPLLLWKGLAQVAEQVSVGTVFVPVKEAWKPKAVLPAAAMAPL